MRTLSGSTSDEHRNCPESANTATSETSARATQLRTLALTSLDTRPLQKQIRNEAKLSQRWELFDVLLINRKLLHLFISITSLAMVSSIVCSRVREFHLDFCMTLCLSSLSSSVHHVERYRVSKRFSLLLLCHIITQRRYTNPTKPMTIKKHVHNFSCQKKSLLVENIVVEAGGRKISSTSLCSFMLFRAPGQCLRTWPSTKTCPTCAFGHLFWCTSCHSTVVAFTSASLVPDRRSCRRMSCAQRDHLDSTTSKRHQIQTHQRRNSRFHSKQAPDPTLHHCSLHPSADIASLQATISNWLHCSFTQSHHGHRNY